MQRRFAFRGLAFVFLLLIALPLWAQEKTEFFEGQEVVAGEVLVKFRAAALTAPKLAEMMGAHDLDLMQSIGGAGLVRVRSRSKDTLSLVRAFAARPDVEYAEPNYIVYAIETVPNDPRFAELYGLQNTGQTIRGVPGTPGADIGAALAWDLTTGSRANVVGVVDTGIDYTHPDLADNVWAAPTDFTVTIGDATITCAAGTHGFNAITNTCNPLDDHFHGTHVSGTIGAVGNNSLGVTGVNWTASIMGLKFLNSAGSGTTANAINAIEFAVQAKAAFSSTGGANVRILSNSWGGGGFSQALLDEINRANDNDLLFVAAAGNNGRNIDPPFAFYPASYDAPNMLAVAATDNNDDIARFSNFGAVTVHLGAPGVNVLSTVPRGGYSYLSGTSMATPHVSGAAALVLALCALDTAGLKDNLLSNIDLIPSLDGTTITGGRLNVNSALLACSAPPIASVTAPSALNSGGAGESTAPN